MMTSANPTSPNHTNMMTGDGARVSIVGVDPSTSLVPPPASAESAPSLLGRRRPTTEKAPLLSQRRLFNSLSGLANGLNGSSPESSGGYTEFGSSIASLTPPSSTPRTLGTFSGVFCPVALSMFSALLFLRVGFIVGNAGLYFTLIQFAIAYTILLFTVLSICAISTNGAVEGGGAYFMISRTLGPEFGGAIGALFIFANIVSSALYIVGCVEGIVDNFGVGGSLTGSGGGLPTDRTSRFLYCSLINLLNLVVCLVGSSLFAKTSVAVLTVVGVSVLSVIASFFQDEFPVDLPEGNTLARHNNITHAWFTGFNGTTFSENLSPESYGKDYTTESGDTVNFAIVFGVLFSGVTGIMAGANMSGELVNPGKSIPKGTISAVGFTFFVYVLLSFLAAATCSNFLLQNDYIFMMGINLWQPFVTIGILTATFSASLSNLIGASRVLEAVAKDDIFGPVLRFLNSGTTRGGNPIASVLMCFVIVELFLLIGSLNIIAQLNSVLFLLSYFAMNLACLGLDLASAPNFRPAFKYFSAKTAFVGMVGTLAMMFVINAIYASLSIIACLVLVIMLHLLSTSRSASNWGSISQALIFHQVRKYLLLLDSRKDHVKFWRPQMLLLVANPRSACPLIDFVNDLKKSGLYVLGHVYSGEFDEMEVDPATEDYSSWLSLVDHLKVKAFIELTVARTFREGMHHLVRISGLGAMRPNTIVLGFHDDTLPVDFFSSGEAPIPYRTDKFPPATFPMRRDEGQRLREEEYVEVVRDIIKMNKNVVLCRNMALLDKAKVARKKHLFVDVWPINFFSGDANSLMDTSSLFLLQLACILNMTPLWKSLTLRVFLLCTSTTTSAEAASREAELRRMLQILRIKARTVVIPWDSVLGKQLPSGVGAAGEPHPDLFDSAPQWPLKTIRPDYIKAVNDMIKEQAANTAVSFLFLPEIPMDKSEYRLYFHHLTSLSEDVGPMVYVHGVSTVTSTTI
ncbi:solute carrier family 12 member 9 [Folsomia candida]|nr:solute carrier family 12 member 9 [Folsomia candida]